LLVASGVTDSRGSSVALAPALLVLVPGAAYLAWRVEPAWLLIAALVLCPLAGHWGEFGIPGPAAPDRLLVVAAIGSILLRPRLFNQGRPLRIAFVHWLMLGALVWVGLSAIAVGTLGNIGPFAKLFDAFGVTPYLAFLVAPIAFRERRHRDILLVALVALGAYLGATAIFERTGVDALVFPKYILDPNVGTQFGRARGPFVEAVSNGFALSMCAIACLIAFKQWPEPRGRRISVTVLMLCIAGIILTMQRSVWLAAGAATVVTIATLAGNRRKAVKGVVAIAVAIGIALLTIPGLYSDISARFEENRTVHDRENLNRAAVNMFEERPLLGFGWGLFAAGVPQYFEQADDYPLGNLLGAALHNTALTYLVELGLIGAVLWGLALLLGVGGGLPRRGPPDLDDWRIGLLALAIVYAVIENFVPPQVFPNLALWIWAGIGWVGFQDHPQ
jgi:O-antigen ligase